MKKEAKILLGKAIESLTLSIEIFNRPNDSGRVHGVLIFLDHAMEMFLKAAILHQGGRIRERRAKQTIGFDACVRKSLSDGDIKFLTKEQALTLQTINGQRDAAQHYLLDMAEQQLYLLSQAGLTLLRDLAKSVFNIDLKTHLPERVLPLSTTPPVDLDTLFDSEVREVRRLLRPGSRHQIEARAKLRALAIMESSVQGEKVQPGRSSLNKISKMIVSGQKWDQVFPGVASINFTSKGYGPSIDLRITKKKGTPVTIVPEGTPGATTVAIKRVDDLGFYSLGRDQVAKKVGLSGPRTTAVMRHLDLESDPECFKLVTISKSRFKRYSQKAVKKIQDTLRKTSIEAIWKSHGIRTTRKQR